jgi:hypothetical protein
MTLSPQPGHPLNLRKQEVSFSIQRITYHAPRRYAVLSSRTGLSTSTEALFITPRIDSGDYGNREFRFFLPDDAELQEITNPVEFRLYAYEANYNHETRLTSFTITQYPGPTHVLTTNAGPGGTVFPPEGSRILRGGETIELRATPADGQRFGRWQGPVTPGRTAVRTVVLNGDTSVTALFEPRPALSMTVGMNLGGVTDWATAWTFTDWFRRMRTWRTRNADGSGAWDSNQAQHIPRDENDWVVQVPFSAPSQPPQMVHTIQTEVQSTGIARLRWEGAGTFRFGAPGNSTHTFTPTGGPGVHDFTIPTRNGTLFLEILSTGGADYLRNFRIESPGFVGQTDAQVFHPAFLGSLQGFRGLRFMDWQKTNGSPLVNWGDRTTTASATQARHQGVALEYMALLSNTLNQDAWICIPHRADDELVRETARLLRDQVEPHLRILVEYSNETWNTSGPFSQTVYVQDQGQALNLSPDRWQAGQLFVARRSAQIWKIFEEEFSGPHASRLVKVLAAHAGNPATANLRLRGLVDPVINPDQVQPDALAIAPYFGVNYTPANITANGYPTVDEVVTSASISAIQQVRDMVRNHRAIADAHGWDLICYEGGQHFVGVGGAEGNTTLTQILIAANRDPRMYDRYIEYLNALQEEGVREFYNFSHVGAPSQWGSWGVLETQDQPLETAHKMRALRDWIANNPVPVVLSHWAAE